VAPGLARRRHRGAAAEGSVSWERLSAQLWAPLEEELHKGPLAHGFADDQRWTLGRIKTAISKLFHVRYTDPASSTGFLASTSFHFTPFCDPTLKKG
jgi:hypothetical protein